MCWMDFHSTFLCCRFLCARRISLYFVSILCLSFPATTPRATTPHPYHHGLSRLCIHPGYHTRAITLHHTRTSGYHTRHSSSYFVVYRSPAITPPVLLHLHHHRGATRTNLLHTLAGSIERVGRALLSVHEENRIKTFVGGKVRHPSRRGRQRRRGTRVLLGQCTTRWSSCFIKCDRGPCQRPSASSAND